MNDLLFVNIIEALTYLSDNRTDLRLLHSMIFSQHAK